MSTDNLPAERSKFYVPSVEELFADDALEVAGKMSQLAVILNTPPPQKWLVPHPIATKEIINAQGKKEKVPTDYLPIAKVEYLLTRIFIRWEVKVKEVQTIANSAVVTVTLRVLDPVTQEWLEQDGVGAAPISTEKGAAATDFTKVQTSSVQKAVPAAKSYAIKDAAECFGKVFGKDLNRMGEMDYQTVMSTKANALGPVPEELALVIELKTTEEELDEIWNANPEYHANRDFITRMKSRRGAIAKKEETI